MNKKILKLAVPAIFNNITVPLLGLSDTAITGHLGSDAYLAAMAVGASMFSVIFMLCGFLRMGTTGLAAQATGASDYRMARDVLKKSLLIAAVISIVVLSLKSVICKLLISLIGASEDVSGYAEIYFSLVVWSVPAQLAVMAISGWFIGRQNTVIPMIVSVGINIVNISISIILVYSFNMGFSGVAIGTLAANWVGLVAMGFFLRNEIRKTQMNAGLKNARESWRKLSTVKWSTFFKINSNLFFRSACIMSVSLAMTAYGARIGETALAANNVMLQFFLFFSYFMDGFAFAGEALVGNAAGASDGVMLKRVVRALVKWGCALSVIFAIGYMVGGSRIVALLSNSETVLKEIMSLRWWLSLLPVVTVWAFIYDGVFIGLTRTRPLLYVTVAGALLFFAITQGAELCSKGLDNYALWSAFEGYLLVRGVLLALRYLLLQRKSLIL